MAQLPLKDAIPRFKANDDRANTFVNGDENTDYIQSGGTPVPSIPKFLKQKNDEINVAAGGILAQSEVARDAAITAKGQSEAARDAAVTAKGQSEAARDAAVAATASKANLAGGNQFTGAQLVEGGPLLGGIPPTMVSLVATNDLNDAKKSGHYRVTSPGGTPLLNGPTPTLGNMKLVVEQRDVDRIHQELKGDLGTARRVWDGTTWGAWVVAFDEQSLAAPALVAKNRLIDRNDIRDYEPGIPLTGSTGYAVDKFKAAAAAFTDDGEKLSVLSVPRARIRFGESWLINKLGFKMKCAGRQHWGRPYGETTGGSLHPLTGTQFETVGSGTARRWSDVSNGGAGDEAKKPMIVIGMPGVELEGFSLVTPRTGANIWDDGIRLLGVDGCKITKFNVYGGWDNAGIFLDATHSKNNNAMNSIIDGYGLAPTRDANLMSYGITDNLFEDLEASGVNAFKLQGTTRGKGAVNEYNANTWLWSPNGVSDTKVKKFRFYQFGNEVKRKASGALIYLDHRLFTGGSPNNSGQNITFENGRLDGAGKWAIYMENIDVAWFRQIFGETSGAWFTAQAQRNIIERTAACGPDRLFNQCKLFFNAVTNGGAETTIANNYWDGRGVMS